VKYFTFVGSYDGAVKIKGHWVRCVELNRIDKTGWERVHPTPAALKAARERPAHNAQELFGSLIKFPRPAPTHAVITPINERGRKS
jgi:hypothetical protein